MSVLADVEEGFFLGVDDDEDRPVFLRSRSFLVQSLTNERTLASFSGASESYASVAYEGRFFSFSTRISLT